MSLPLKWSVKDCASTLYACGFHLDEKDMLSKPKSKKKDLKEKKSKTKIDDVKQSSNADKEYIVFRFKEDGGIDLVEEKSPPRNRDRLIDGMQHNHKALKELPIDKKSEGLQFKVNEDGVIILDNEGEEKRTINSSKKLPPSDENGDGDDIKVITAIEESKEQKILSESTRSDSSAGSFAFPVMNLETIGSPERMPKYNEQNKIERILRFPCCRF